MRQGLFFACLIFSIVTATVVWADDLIGDLNGDQRVDFKDLGFLAEQWLDRRCLVQPCEADLDGLDGVDGKDFAILAGNWSSTLGGPLITEFMASNGSAAPLDAGELLDEDGDSSDWIELHNPTDRTIDLGGWYLTDDPNELDKWRFPQGVILDPGAFLVVFASGKNRAVAGAELHTNFRLDADGGYLALVQRDGRTIAHAYSPGYPRQLTNISYGLAQYASTFVPAGAQVRYHIPNAQDALADWTAVDFDDSQWNIGKTGLGFGNATPGFQVIYYKANVPVDSLSTAELVIRDPAYQSQVATETTSVINYLDNGANGHFGADRPFPGMAIGDNADDFVVLVTAMVLIPQAGQWTFGVNSDDGFGLELTDGINTFTASYPNPRAAADTLAMFNFPQWGLYRLRLVFYERGGNAELELFAAQGSHTSYNSNFRLVGDYTNGGLYVNSFGTEVQTDIQQQMQAVNSALWLRATFTVDETDFFSSLVLRMKYDDGFVAYLNGVEVARDNFSGVPAWNSAADSNRPNELASAFVHIDLSRYVELLREGTNVLAICGLNEHKNDQGFLVLPELVGAGEVSVAQYFATATPGQFNSSGAVNIVADTKFSVDRGFYEAPFYVEITTETEGATIHYTTDGSMPSETHGKEYTGPILISKTTCLRAMAFKPGWISSNVDTHTYIFLNDVLHQPSDPPGFPAYWGGTAADYEMDPYVVNHPNYKDEIKQDLLSLPTMSLVMDVDDLFGPQGIYSNPWSSGPAWERPGSIELIYPDGRVGFQVNCGVRIYGGVGRREPKKTLRLLFKRAYGPTKLNYPLFGDDATDRFDTIILRAGFNNSWHGVYNQGPQYIRDEWIRRTQLEMGRLGLHGTFVHLYVNGLYWGLYNPTERCNADFGTAYMGGEKEDYDALNSYPRNVVDGTADAWIAAQNIASAGVADEDGFKALAQYVDIPNLIDYMILNFYGGNQDWDDHNWYAVRRRAPGEGWKFIAWDSERVLESITGHNRTSIGQYNKPSWLYKNLRANPEFRMLFADHAHKHLFHDGVLTPEKARARYKELADQIYGAIVCESARWGDCKHSPARTRDNEWVAERDRLLNQYFPQRTEVVIGFLRNAGLYPDIDAPEFFVNGTQQYGGHVSVGDVLTMSAPRGTIYYTTDGNDPRLPAFLEVTGTTLVRENAVKHAWVPTTDIGDAWRTDPGFDDSTWLVGGSDNGALDFDGSGSYVETNRRASQLGIGGGAVKTITAWVYTRSFNNGGIYEMGEHTSGRDFSLRTLGTDNRWRVQHWGGAYDIDFTYDSKNKWVHFAHVYDGSRVTIYANGQVVASAARTLNTADTKTFHIGRWADYFFDGMIDDVRIYNTALSAQAVQVLASGGQWNDGLIAHWKFDETAGQLAEDSAGDNDGTIYGNAAWKESSAFGAGGVGYERNSGYEPYITIDVGAAMKSNASCYIRIPFTLQTDPSSFNFMTLQVRYDDGFVAYLNGTEVARRNFTGTPTWNSSASTQHSDSAAVNFEDIDISNFLDKLHTGDNLLAIHGLNISLTSSDFLISARLVAGQSTPASQMLSDSAIEYTGPLTLNRTTHIKARALEGTRWSALSETTFAVGSVADNLRITEIMYHPAEEGGPNDPNEEFIELQNIGTQSLNLNMVRFTAGISFVFPDMELPGGEYVLVVADRRAFEAQYGSGYNIAGEYTGRLDNGGERIVLADAAGQIIQQFRYKDGWYPSTDGAGFSLVIRDANDPDPNNWSRKEAWRASTRKGGSPGQYDHGLAPGTVVINEVLAHSHAEASDWIELYNTTDSDIDISGWYLSDDSGQPFKYVIDDGTVIPAGGYRVFFEHLHFRNPLKPNCLEPFGLSENGEEVVLTPVLGGVPTGNPEIQRFGASATGIAFGRYRTSTGQVHFVAMSTNTPGLPNAYPKVGPVVISEIMYNPAGDRDAEFVELHNITGQWVYLFDEYGNPWKFSDENYAIDFNLPAEANVPPYGYLLLVKDEAVFRSTYPSVPAGVQLLDWDTPAVGGRLDNGGELIRISAPGDIDNSGRRHWIDIDVVEYNDRLPWPSQADGFGASLSRILPERYGNDPNNWSASAPSPGW